MQRSCTLVLRDVAGRDHISGIEAETSRLTEEKPELQPHQRVVEAHGCNGASVGRNVAIGICAAFVDVIELGKVAHTERGPRGKRVYGGVGESERG
jgi:hypothetical protein